MKNGVVFLSFQLLLLVFFNLDLSGYVQIEKTPTLKYLRTIPITEPKSGLEGVDCIYVINLDIRPEKWSRMQELFKERGLFANRVNAINGWELSEEIKKELFGHYYIRLLGGPIGCLLSHISVYKDAYERGFETILVCEDDVDFVGDVQQIPSFLEKLSKVDPVWDVLYTDIDSRDGDGGFFKAYNIPARPDQKVSPGEYYEERSCVADGIISLRNRCGCYSMLISRRGLEKLVNYFSYVYIWNPIDFDIHHIPNIREYGLSSPIMTNVLWLPTASDTSFDSPLNPNNKKE
jgi:hypothetical protein